MTQTDRIVPFFPFSLWPFRSSFRLAVLTNALEAFGISHDFPMA
jgi:hypothetical protein